MLISEWKAGSLLVDRDVSSTNDYPQEHIMYLYSSKNISFWASEPVRRIQNNFAVDPYTNATFYIKQRCGSGSKVPSYSATLWIRIRIPSTDLDPHRQKFTIQRLI